MPDHHENEEEQDRHGLAGDAQPHEAIRVALVELAAAGHGEEAEEKGPHRRQHGGEEQGQDDAIHPGNIGPGLARGQGAKNDPAKLISEAPADRDLGAGCARPCISRSDTNPC